MNKRLLIASMLILGLGALNAANEVPASPQSPAAPQVPAAPEAPSSTSSFTQADEQKFYQQLQDEMTKTSNRVEELEKKVTAENKDFEGELKDEFTSKVDTLAAKQTLYKNFENTPSIQDPKVREELLKTFKKEVLTDKDLEELQQTVDQEKAKGLPQS